MKYMPDTVIDLAKAGFTVGRKRLFNPEKLIVNVFNVQFATSEWKRNKIQEKPLIKNYDNSRRYPQYARRHQASPFV